MIIANPIITVQELTKEQRALLAAAELLERDGWCQGAYCDEEGARCAVGAITRATLGFEYDHADCTCGGPDPCSDHFYDDHVEQDDLVMPVIDRVLTHLGLETGDADTLIVWNDAEEKVARADKRHQRVPLRTADEVIRVFREAALR